MDQEREILFGNSKKCLLDVNGGTVQLASDPELTVSSYPVRGLSHGEMFILVTRTSIPAIVSVEASNHGTDLQVDEIEQIRKSAEGIFRGTIG
jgi:hypothetical protein